MPQCPHCQATVIEGQRYCGECESYLLQPEGGNIVCPQCGIRVAPGQEVCHKCNAGLPAAGAALTSGLAAPPESPRPPTPEPPRMQPQAPPPGNPGRPSLPPWIYFILGGMSALIVVLAVLLYVKVQAPSPPPAPAPVAALPAKPPAPTPEPQPAKPEPPKPEPAKPEAPQPEPAKPEAPKPEPAKPETPEVKPATPETFEPKAEPPKEASLQEQLEGMLKDLREAQLKKDIILYLSCYSYLFPNLDQKRKDALRYWERFTFHQLMFSLEDVKAMGEDKAYAKVTWEIQVQGMRSEESEEITQIYKVGFSRELGRWRIRSLREVEE